VKRLFLALFLALFVVLAMGQAPPVWGATPVEQAQQAELDRVRAAVADQVQLTAYDLIDELVYGWVTEPVFPASTPVVLAGVTVPVGLGTGLQALVENHVAAVLAENPTTNIQLAHCPACTATVVQSGPEVTIVSRGLDNPNVLAEIGSATGRHALFLDIEAEGAWLVLRARITRLTPDLPIVWSHTIASSASTPPLLRQPGDLKSATQARAEYLDALRDRGPIAIPARFVIRTYAAPGDQGGVPPPPFLWLQTGVELGANESLAWTSSIVVGYSFIPQAYQGLMAQARISRLMTGRTRSHLRPDLYGFFGVSAISVWGAATGSFRTEKINADEILMDSVGDGPRTTFGAIQLGLDLRLGNRIGLAVFLETMPNLSDSRNLGDYIAVGTIGFQAIGTEVGVCF